MDFEEFTEKIKEKGYKLECPTGCSMYGFCCTGNPYTTIQHRVVHLFFLIKMAKKWHLKTCKINRIKTARYIRAVFLWL